MTIEQLQNQLEQGLATLESSEFASLHQQLRLLIPPAGYRARVVIYGPERKRKKNASADNWSPESDTIQVYFEPQRKVVDGVHRQVAPAPLDKGSSPASDPQSDLIRALDRAESRPGFDFVALKWFRDVALPAEGYGWTQSDAARQDVLRGAIEDRLILTSRIPNPRTPQFPVTSIRLNRLLPKVQKILGASGQGAEHFEPVEIRGEALSETILRERR